MLCVSRKINESVYIGTDIEVVVVDVGHGKVRLGIRAPKEVRLLRNELVSDRCDHCRKPLTKRDEYQSTAESVVCEECMRR